MKKSIITKIFKQFYNISGPLDEYKKTMANAIGNTTAIMLYWFNILIVLATVIVGIVTKNYLLAFCILSSSIFIFTIFIAGGYVIYAGHKSGLANQEVEQSNLPSAYKKAILKSIGYGLITAIFEYVLTSTILYLYYGDFISQLQSISSLINAILSGALVITALSIVFCHRIKKVD